MPVCPIKFVKKLFVTKNLYKVCIYIISELLCMRSTNFYDENINILIIKPPISDYLYNLPARASCTTLVQGSHGPNHD